MLNKKWVKDEYLKRAEKLDKQIKKKLRELNILLDKALSYRKKYKPNVIQSILNYYKVTEEDVFKN